MSETALQIQSGGQGLQLRSLSDFMEFAKLVIESGLAPDTLDTPAKVVIVLQIGSELGMPPMTAMQSICVINGKATLYGGAALGLVEKSGLMVSIDETLDGEIMGDLSKTPNATKYVCTVKRVNRDPVIRSFSVGEAKLARLWGQRTWNTHPKRMLMYKARAFALRDTFPDVLMGLHVTEEMIGEQGFNRRQIEATECQSAVLLTGETDGVRTQGHDVEPGQEPETPGGEERSGVPGDAENERSGVLDVGVGEDDGEGQVLQRDAEPETEPDPTSDEQPTEPSGPGCPPVDETAVFDVTQEVYDKRMFKQACELHTKRSDLTKTELRGWLDEVTALSPGIRSIGDYAKILLEECEIIDGHVVKTEVVPATTTEPTPEPIRFKCSDCGEVFTRAQAVTIAGAVCCPVENCSSSLIKEFK